MSQSRRIVVGVMGSGKEEHDHLAAPLGRWLAELGVDLLTGGGRGVMTSVCRAFQTVPQRVGITIGVLPKGPPPGYPNPFIDLVIHTHLAARGDDGASDDSRNHINVLTSDVIVVLPGGSGTRTELVLARRYDRPFIVWLGEGGTIEGMSAEALPLANSLTEVQEFVHARCPGVVGLAQFKAENA